jgi:hypothetical protein
VKICRDGRERMLEQLEADNKLAGYGVWSDITANSRQYIGLTAMVVCEVLVSVPVEFLKPILCYFPVDYLIRILLRL